MRYRLLGPVRVRVGDGWRIPGPPQQQAVLAALLLQPGAAVSAERIADAVWDDTPPRSALTNVRVYVWRLRRLIGDVVRSDGGGYRLVLADGDRDLDVFRRLVADAALNRQCDRLDEAAQAYQRGLRLWQGAALGGLLPRAAAALDAERVNARLALTDVQFRRGRHREEVDALADLAQTYPLDERVREQHIVALLESGRTVDAAAACRATADQFQQELRVAPGQRLQQLFRRVAEAAAAPPVRAPAGDRSRLGAALRQVRVEQGLSQRALAAMLHLGSHSSIADLEAGRRLPPADLVAEYERRFAIADGRLSALRTGALTEGAAATAPGRAVPLRQLPASPADFTGFEAELRQLSEAADSGARYLLITGMPGVGKSTLAIRFAHSRSAEVMLYAPLYGQSAPVTPLRQLSRFLRACGVPAERIPGDLDTAAAMLRSLLADRTCLLVADDAVDEAQIRPLLPSGADDLVVITSRHRLAGLEGAHTLVLKPMRTQTAMTMVTRIAGRDRIESDPHAARQLVQHCGGLPLALRIAGARLRTRPQWTIARMVDRLADDQTRLNELRAGDLAVRASLDVSYRALTEDDQGMLRALACHPSPEVGLAAAARLADRSEAQADTAIEHLLDANLVAETGDDRYHVHDLIRQHARELTSRDERLDAVRRLIAWYADRVRHDDERLAGDGEAVQALAGTIRPWAADVGDAFLGLAWILIPWLRRRSDTTALLTVAESAAGVAADLARPVDQARADYHRAWAYSMQDDPLRCVELLQDILNRATDLGTAGLAPVQSLLGMGYGALGDLPRAIEAARESLRLNRDAGNSPGIAASLNNLGTLLTRAGRPDDAATCHREAISRSHDDQRAVGIAAGHLGLGEALLHSDRLTEAAEAAHVTARQAAAMGNQDLSAEAAHLLARVLIRAGQPREAADHARLAAEKFHAQWRPTKQAQALVDLGRALSADGRLRQARQQWQRALALPLPDADRVLVSKLLPTAPTSGRPRLPAGGTGEHKQTGRSRRRR